MEAALGQPGAPGNALPLVALASVVALVALLYSLHQTTKLATSVRPRPTDGPATRDPEASW